MGCDIHSFPEKRTESGTYAVIPGFEPFGARCYGIFGFLAGVRNYSEVQPVAPARGFPTDASPEVASDYAGWSGDAHTASWLTVEELIAFNYDAEMEDRRCTRQTGPNSWDGGSTCKPGEGKKITFRKFLGEGFFNDLKQLLEIEADRIVFWFDN